MPTARRHSNTSTQKRFHLGYSFTCAALTLYLKFWIANFGFPNAACQKNVSVSNFQETRNARSCLVSSVKSMLFSSFDRVFWQNTENWLGRHRLVKEFGAVLTSRALEECLEQKRPLICPYFDRFEQGSTILVDGSTVPAGWTLLAHGQTACSDAYAI